MALYIGLMSGTSLDGVDAVLADFASDRPQALRHVHLAMPDELRTALLALNTSGDDELHRAALAANGLARLYARAVNELLQQAGVRHAAVRALGAHGQTVRHRPQAFDGTGYTVQLLNGALLAELSSIDTVCDFRTRDLAAGGQGAPLAPGFHAAVFGGATGEASAVLNVGGIANLTLLYHDRRVSGFDCGPGNLLMDAWHARHRGAAFDVGGHWAASGRVCGELLQLLLEEPFFAAPPPKSTGRDLFNADWLDATLARLPGRAPDPTDVMATLCELTAGAVARHLAAYAPATRVLWVCGGGAYNEHLMRRLAALCPALRVDTTEERGVAPDQVEALAFAWLARAHIEQRPGNLPAVTGARGARLLGALYPA